MYPVFMVDTGTRFHEKCLYYLIQHMLQHPSTVAVSGKQRVMTYNMQEGGSWYQEGFKSMILRFSQGFDYEASVNSFSGGFSLTGMLPVIPGPCGLFRLDLLSNTVGNDKEIQQRIKEDSLQSNIHSLELFVGKQKRIFADFVKCLLNYCKDEVFQNQRLIEKINNPNVDRTEDVEKDIKKILSLMTEVNLINKNFSENVEYFVLFLSTLLKNSNMAISISDIITFVDETIYVFNNTLKHIEKLVLNMKAIVILKQDTKIEGVLYEIKLFIEEQQIFTLANVQKNVLNSIKPEEKDALRILVSNHTDENTIQFLKSSRDPLEFYFRCVNQNPEEVGLLLGSLLLAEDRILSSVAVLHCREKVTTEYVPKALFDFQAETQIETLIQQRRRWLNGSVAGYMWLISMMRQNVFRQRLNFICKLMILMQIAMYGVMCFSPMILTLTVDYIIPKGVENNNKDIIVWSYYGLYSLFVLLHVYDTTKFRKWLFTIIAIVNGGIIAYTTYTLVSSILGIYNNTEWCGAGENLWGILGNPLWGLNVYCWIKTAVILIVLFLPYVFAIFHDLSYFLSPEYEFAAGSLISKYNFNPFRIRFSFQSLNNSSFIKMILYAPFFYIFLPSMICYFFVYAIANVQNLSWGNRVTCSFSGKSTKTESELVIIKKDMIQTSHVITGLVWAGNTILLFAAQRYKSNEMFLLLCMIVILGFSLLQMLVTLVWNIVVPFGRFLRVVFACCFPLCFKNTRRHRNQMEINNNEIKKGSETIKIPEQVV